MHTAAFNPSEELLENLLNLWPDHLGKKFLCAVEARLQWLISGLPWLLGLLPLIAQDFIRNTLHFHPATIASLPSPPEDVLPSPSAQPSDRKQRSHRRRPLPQSDPETSELPAMVIERDNNPGFSDCGTVYSGVVFFELLALPAAQPLALPVAQSPAQSPVVQSPAQVNHYLCYQSSLQLSL